MNQEQWTNRFNQLQSSQDAAHRKAMERQIQQEHVMTGLTSGSSYPTLDQAANDRSRLTYDGLVHDLKHVKSRLEGLNDLGPQPQPSGLLDRLTARVSQWFGRSARDSRETFGNKIQAFSRKLEEDAKQEGLDFNKAIVDPVFRSSGSRI